MGKITNLSSFGSRRGSTGFTSHPAAGVESVMGGGMSTFELFREGRICGDFMTGFTMGITIGIESVDDI